MKPAIALLLLLATAAVAAPVDQEIDYLLNFVAGSGCTFLRNNSAHDSADAADHLRNKYATGKRWVSSAEQFIDRIATGSSISGKPYRVSCDEIETNTGAWLHQALEQHRALES